MTRRTYYKATRPNGTDFYTGTVDYGAALIPADGKIDVTVCDESRTATG